jgi:glutamyl-tRNA reductase
MLQMLPASDRTRLLLDLGVPADTHISTCELPGFLRMDVIEISRRAETNEQEAKQLRNAVKPHLDKATLKFKERIFQRNLGPVANKLRQAVEERTQMEADRWLKSKLTHLHDSDKELFRQFAARLAEQTVQVPLIALKKALREMPMGETILAQLRREGRRAQQSAQEEDTQ